MNRVEKYWHTIERKIEKRTGVYMPNIYLGTMAVCTVYLLTVGEVIIKEHYKNKHVEQQKQISQPRPSSEKTLEDRTTNPEEIKH